MSRSLRNTVRILTAAALTAAGSVAAPAAIAQQAGPGQPAPQVAWVDCPETVTDPAAQCGEVEVPMNHADPGGPKITVGFLKLPATGAKHGTVFANPGGPGGEVYSTYGADTVLDIPQRFRENFDLVAVQPRGLPGSTPTDCVDHLGEDPVRAVLAPIGAQRDACEAAMPGYSDQLTTENTARDWEAVRAALGEERINILGLSYGTLLGSVYATLFPEHTDKVVLDSGYAPSTMWSQVVDSQKGGYERALNDFFGWLAANDATYHLGATPLAAYQSWSAKISEQAGTNPTVAPPPAQLGDVPAGLEWAGQSAADLMTMTGQQRVQLEGLASQAANPGANQSASPVLNLTRGLVPMPRFWDKLAGLINGTVTEQEIIGLLGGPQPEDAENPEGSQNPEDAAAPAADGEDEEISPVERDAVAAMMMHNIIICNESTAPVDPTRLPESVWFNMVTGDLFAGPPAAAASGQLCAGAPAVAPVPAVDGARLEHRPLQLQATGDPQTVYGNFGEMAERMNSRVVTVHGPGHGQFAWGNPVADDLVIDYLETGEVTAAEIPGIDPTAAAER